MAIGYLLGLLTVYSAIYFVGAAVSH